MARSGGCPPQRTQRAADTVELWDPRGSVHIADWRRATTVTESELHRSAALHHALAEVNRRRPGAEPHRAPRWPAWLPLRLDIAAAGWRWGLIVDDRLLLPARPAAAWIESGAALPQSERAGTWWRVSCPDDHHWAWYVAAGTLEGAVRRALHGAAPIATAVAIARAQIRHELLIASVDVTPPGGRTIRLVAQDLGDRLDPAVRWGCLLADDLDSATNLCA